MPRHHLHFSSPTRENRTPLNSYSRLPYDFPTLRAAMNNLWSLHGHIALYSLNREGLRLWAPAYSPWCVLLSCADKPCLENSRLAGYSLTDKLLTYSSAVILEVKIWSDLPSSASGSIAVRNAYPVNARTSLASVSDWLNIIATRGTLWIGGPLWPQDLWLAKNGKLPIEFIGFTPHSPLFRRLKAFLNWLLTARQWNLNEVNV